MSQPNTRITFADRRQDDEVAPIIMKWAGLARRFWFWIVLSVVACLAVGVFYQLRQPRVFHSQAVILIESNDGSGTSPIRQRSRSQLSPLLQLNGINSGDNLENEMYILSSLRLMGKVVPKLGLDVDYTVERRLHTVALYKDRPFRVTFAERAETAASFDAAVRADGRIELSNFERYGRGEKLSREEAERVIAVSTGDTVSTPAGRLVIDRDVAFDTFERGQAVHVMHYTLKQAAARYRSEMSAKEYDKESTLVVVGCNDVNRDRAEDIIFEVIEAYKQDVVDNKNSVAQRTAEFIDGRLVLISQELSAVENELASFKAANNITDLTATATAMTQQSVQARNQATQLSTELSVAQYLSDYLRTTPGSKDVIPVISNFKNSAVSSQISEYNRMVLERNRIAGNSSDETFAVRDMDRQLESMRSAINNSLSGYVKGIELELRAAEANERHYTGQANLVPVKERRALDITRQQTLKETLYTYLLNKREETALQLAIEEANVRIIEDPASGNAPISPRTRIILLISLVCGLAIPFLILYLIELFDTTVSSRQDAEALTHAPIAGEIPHTRQSTDSYLAYGPDADLSTPAAEAFRLLRYGLHYICPAGKTLLVTSATPSQGKSFVSRNLAACFAMAKQKVLLVDADIRVRNVTRSFNAAGQPGLTECLIGDVTAEQAIIANGVTEGVDLLPAGSTPPNTTEILMEGALDRLIESLRGVYDIIVLDTTPAFSVADASIVSRVADLTLFVVRVGEQSRAGMAAVEELYNTKKCGNLCIVVNDADLKTRTYGYGYKTGYRYGYGYGYQYGYGKSKKPWWAFWRK